MTTPSYKVYADWDADGGLSIGDFEFGLDGWDPSATGALPTVAQSTTRSYHGTTSMLVTWSAGTSQLVQADPWSGLTVGNSYTYSAWVYVPSSGGMHVKCTVAGISSGTASSTTNTWVQITYTFTATATTHSLQISANTSPSGGEQTWVDHVRIIGPGEDLTATAPGVISDVTVQFGRDQARSLQPVSPGEAAFDVDNVSRDYSPENTASPLIGLLGPGRDALIEATLAGRAYTVFHGNLDDFTVDSTQGKWLASFSAVDALARLKDLPVSTAVYPAVRTGQAIGYILDAIGWAGQRDLDPGGSTIRWWNAESDDAYREMLDVLSAEGPDSLITVGSSGEFIFRDRHHRLNRAASLTSQVTFTNGVATGGQVEHDEFKLDFGWRDIINEVQFDVTDREPVPVAEQIWMDENTYIIAAGEHRQFQVVADDPFWDVVDPTQGLPSDLPTEGVAHPDFVSDQTLTVAFSRRSGKSTTVDVSCTSAAIIFKMSLRAYPVKRTDDVKKIVRSDAASIASVGLRSRKEASPWIGAEDAGAVADLIIGKRAQRLPVVTFTVVNGTSTAITHQLARDLSDRVTVVDSESGFNADCFIEKISHEITDDGNTHRTTFACEKIPTLPSNVFRFDTAGSGFNDGVFGPNGLIDPADVFRFDTAGQGFNDGLLAF